MSAADLVGPLWRLWERFKPVGRDWKIVPTDGLFVESGVSEPI